LRIRAEEAVRRVQSGEPATVLDVRNPNAWDGSHEKARGAVRFQPAQVSGELPWPRDRLTVVY
jgi:hypothetical protein